ncbi:hypothetical protein Aglo03_16570 [Actinokineospora globicatena]|uniref:Uncharacterized protein n=1 Tax=Actinokineospora globicatena TaxID=103729 RepID=A0A9W6QGZ0_9PSEU|nr:hypothetical protein Aglo03_16570 [Actinokineospora globicatena]
MWACAPPLSGGMRIGRESAGDQFAMGCPRRAGLAWLASVVLALTRVAVREHRVVRWWAVLWLRSQHHAWDLVPLLRT